MPATGNFLLDKGYDAAGVLVKKRACKMVGEELVGPITAIADVPIGVAQFDVSAAEIAKGKGASVRLAGISVMECSAAIAAGALVQMAADGRAAPYTGASGARILGLCTKGATTAGNEVSVALDLPGGLA
jgi:Uncharacterized conserved protein (DUF2190)